MSKNIVPPMIALTALGLLLAATGAGAGVRAQLDRDRIYDGDTLTLTIEADGSNENKRPDLSVLDPDFRVLGTGSGTQIQIINGRRSDTRRWTVILEPYRVGPLQIPPIAVGSEKTQPLTLEVSEIPLQDTAGEQAELFIELASDSTSGFVQQQIPLTVRLFSALPIREGVLTEPRVENGRVEQLGDSRRYTTERKGRRYQVIERRYVLFPERSGKLRIPPVVFRGSLVASREPGSRRRGGASGGDSLFEQLRHERFFSRTFSDPMLDRLFNDDFFQNPFGSPEPGKRISARSRGLDIEVKPRPQDYRGSHWLPARQLTLDDSWADAPPELRVGEPVTRTITVRAEGAEGAQIPPLMLAQAEGLRVYPEPPVSETRTDGKRVFGISRQTMAIVPKKAGDLVVPEIELNWWDTDALRERTTSIPSWRVVVEAGSGASTGQAPAPSPPVPSLEPSVQDQGELQQTGQVPPEATRPTDPASPPSFWPWLGGGAGALFIAVLSGWLLWRRHRESGMGVASGDPNSSRHSPGKAYRAAQAAFRRACEANDAEDAARTLLDWAAEAWADHPPRSLGAMASRVYQGAVLIRELDRSLYASEVGKWEGKRLWEALRGGLGEDAVTRDTKRNTPDLPPLYPKHG